MSAALPNRGWNTMDSNFWKRRCNKEQEAQGTFKSFELPWLEAASARPRHVPGLASTFSSVEQLPLHVATHPHGSHDKAVDRSASQSSSPTRLNRIQSPMHFGPASPSRIATLPASPVRSGPDGNLIPSNRVQLRLSQQADWLRRQQGQKEEWQRQQLSVEAAHLAERVRKTEAILDHERAVTDCKRKALYAASYRSTTAGQASIWHPRDAPSRG